MGRHKPRQRKTQKEMIAALADVVYQCIQDYFAEYGYAPSIADIAERTHLSRGGVLRYLDRLELQGRIQRDYRIPRAIRLIESTLES